MAQAFSLHAASLFPGTSRSCLESRSLSSSHSSQNGDSLRPPLLHLPLRAQCTASVNTRQRQRQRALGPRAIRESPYEILGVPRSATEKEIKRAYRKMALKYHPDVNKAPDAEKQFMRMKQAYQSLTEAATASSSRSSSYAGRASSAGQRTSSRWSGSASDYDFNWRKEPEEPFYSLDDFFKDLSADWEKRRREGRPKSLWQELAVLGEEFIEYLEHGLNITDDTSGAKSKASSSTSSSSSTSHRSSSSSSSSSTYRSGRSSSQDSYGYQYTRSGNQNRTWAEDMEKKGKAVAEDVEKELQRLKREMGL